MAPCVYGQLAPPPHAAVVIEYVRVPPPQVAVHVVLQAPTQSVVQHPVLHARVAPFANAQAAPPHEAAVETVYVWEPPPHVTEQAPQLPTQLTAREMGQLLVPPLDVVQAAQVEQAELLVPLETFPAAQGAHELPEANVPGPQLVQLAAQLAAATEPAGQGLQELSPPAE